MDLLSYAELAVRLVNGAAPAERGRDGLETVEAYRALVADRPYLAGRVTAADLEGLRQLRGELKLIFTAAAAGRQAEVAERLNTLLTRHPVQPHLVRHDDHAWHAHLVESGSAADRYAASAAAGLGGLIAGFGMSQLGICAGDGCQRPVIGAGSGEGRRYCSSQCASQSNVHPLHARGHPAASTAAS